jgi:hypothetical protein
MHSRHCAASGHRQGRRRQARRRQKRAWTPAGAGGLLQARLLQARAGGLHGEGRLVLVVRVQISHGLAGHVDLRHVRPARPEASGLGALPRRGQSPLARASTDPPL